ncbi:MAG: LPS export ABC transporter periplasmic protein LptC [Desulfovibrionales bacterium]
MASLKRNILLFGIFLVITVGLGIWGVRLVFQDFIPQELTEVDVSVDVSLRGITLSHGENGTLEWSLSAKLGEYEQGSEVFHLSDPVITYYVRDREGEMVITAPRGKVERKENHARLWPDVRVIYGEYEAVAEEMLYEGNTREITLLRNVALKKTGLAAYADRADLDLKTESVVLTGNVRTILQGSDVSRMGNGEKR